MSIKDHLLAFLREFNPSLYKDMATIKHGYKNSMYNPYHMEGSILTHTEMVIGEAVKRYPEKIEIAIAALLHDIGKTRTCEDIDETQRRRFSNHEAVSTFMAKPILEALGHHYAFNKDLVLKIISLHGSFYNYFEPTGIPEKHHKKIANMFGSDTFLLDNVVAFIACDHSGRIQEGESNLDSILKDFVSIRRLMMQSMYKTITVLVGPPRAGKSTWVSKNHSVEALISRDNLVLQMGTGDTYSECWASLTDEMHKEIDTTLYSNFQAALREHSDIIIDMTNMSKKSRNKWLAPAKGYTKKAIVFIEDSEVLTSRNNEEKFIPLEVTNGMIERFVMPMYDEFDTITIK